MLTPARREGIELLDDPATPAHVRRRAMADVARSNSLFGGRRVAIGALRRILGTLPRHPVIVDVGTGVGDIPSAAAAFARDHGVFPCIVGADLSVDLLRSARGAFAGAVAADVRALPLADASADVVMCSQLLHHFPPRDALAVIAELHRVARGWIIIADLRRSWFAALGFWLASTVLRFDRVTRHDGVVSVLRGFTTRELEDLVERATGVRPRVERAVFWRIAATWRARGG